MVWGVHSLDGSVAEEAAYVRTALQSALMNRAAGVMIRRWRDMDTDKREPYFRDPYEVLVGLTDAAGIPSQHSTKCAGSRAWRRASI